MQVAVEEGDVEAEAVVFFLPILFRSIPMAFFRVLFIHALKLAASFAHRREHLKMCLVGSLATDNAGYYIIIYSDKPWQSLTSSALA